MKIPSYRRHSTRDVGFVEHKGRRHYLPGKWKSAESQAAYRQFIVDNVGAAPPDPSELRTRQLTVSQLVAAFLDYAAAHYGRGTRGEYANCKHALIPLARSEYGPLLASQFGPRALKEWQAALVAKKHSRTYVNQQASKIKRAFRWAASEELIPVTVHQALATVQGLQAGRTDALETAAKQPVDDAHVEPVLAELSPLVADMVRIQRLTGVRSGSLVRATPEQFTKDGSLLLWRPRHKNEFRGRSLVVPVGPRAAAILADYLDRDPAAPLFDPGTQRANKRYGERYTTATYYRAVARAIERVNAGRRKLKEPPIPRWTPHQLRHTRAQEIREAYGIEGAQAALGHDSLEATEIYSSRRLELAKRVAAETG